MRVRMFPDKDRLELPILLLDGRPKDESSINSQLVLVLRPAFAFSMMSCLFPSSELPKGVVVTTAKGLCTHTPFEVVRPSSYDGVQVTYHRLLWSVSPFPDEELDLMSMAFDGRFAGPDERLKP